MSKRASEDELSGIHESFATWCNLILQGIPLLNDEGKAVLKPDGQPWLIPPSAAHMNIIRQFLKDNSIDCNAEKGNPLGVLQEASDLPFGNNIAPFKKQANKST